MHHKWIGIVTASAWLAAGPCAAAEPAAPVAAPAAEALDEVLDEVEVRGTRLYALREAIVKAEERFYARYNELNKVDDFDIECSVAAPTGTRLKQRGCLTRLQRKAQRDLAIEFLQMRRDQADGLTGASPVTDPETVFLARYEEYKENVLYLLNTNADLRRLVREREEAEKRYNAERKRRFKGRWILWKD